MRRQHLFDVPNRYPVDYNYYDAAPPGTDLLAAISGGIPGALAGYKLNTSVQKGPKNTYLQVHGLETEPGDSPYTWLKDIYNRARAAKADFIAAIPMQNNVQGGRSMEDLMRYVGGTSSFSGDVLIPIRNIERIFTREGKREILARAFADKSRRLGAFDVPNEISPRLKAKDWRPSGLFPEEKAPELPRHTGRRTGSLWDRIFGGDE